LLVAVVSGYRERFDFRTAFDFAAIPVGTTNYSLIISKAAAAFRAWAEASNPSREAIKQTTATAFLGE